jgi:hypothetical protein
VAVNEHIAAEIDKANKLGDTIQSLVVSRQQVPTGERNTPLMAYWSLVFEIHRAILCLIDHKFYGAALALLRPTIEAVVRAHVVLMCSEEGLRELRDDEYRTNLATVGAEIDAAFGTGNLFEKFLNESRKALHSYTHAGLSQIGRRFQGTDLAANFRESEVIAVIHVSMSAAFMVNNLVTKHFGFEKEWEKNTELCANWGGQ